MKKLISYLCQQEHIAQFIVNTSGQVKTSLNGRVISFDDAGVLIARIERDGTFLEAYPWTSVCGVLTKLPAETDLNPQFNIDALL